MEMNEDNERHESTVELLAQSRFENLSDKIRCLGQAYHSYAETWDFHGYDGEFLESLSDEEIAELLEASIGVKDKFHRKNLLFHLLPILGRSQNEFKGKGIKEDLLVISHFRSGFRYCC
jgi:hypothetical protein